MWMSEPYEQSVEDYKAHPEKYYSYLKGIDEAEFENLNSMFQKKVNKRILWKAGCVFSIETVCS